MCTILRQGNHGAQSNWDLSSYSEVKNNLVTSAASLNR